MLYWPYEDEPQQNPAHDVGPAGLGRGKRGGRPTRFDRNLVT